MAILIRAILCFAAPRLSSANMNPNERAELTRRASAGDADAMQLLVVSQHQRLHALLAGALDDTLRQRIDPEDILQQAYITAFKNLGEVRFESPEHIDNWLQRIAFDRLKDAQRAQRRQKRDVGREAAPPAAAARPSYPDLLNRLIDADPTPSRYLARDEAVSVLMSCLARLDEEQREVVRLRFLEDVPAAEIARRLDKTENAVYALCHRGLKSLRELMVSITKYRTAP